MATTTGRAVGIARISVIGDREEEHLHSMHNQRDRIQALADREGWRLLDVYEEPDVSGDASLEDRPGLSQAVTACLTGAADVIVGAHTERLWWSHEVRAQVLRLVENTGGEVWSADEGRLSNGTAAEEFTGSVRTSADRFSRRQNAEKSRAAVIRAIEQGIMPWPNVPPGYLRGDDGRLKPDPVTASVVAEVFRMRAGGATIAAVRAFLANNGIVRSYHGVGSMLASRVYLGEIHFGDLVNLSAHPAIVDTDTFRRVQRVRVSRGRRAKSDRLLARLDVLRCASCDARMVVGTAHHGQYWLYRCPPTGDCKRRVTISAEIVEGLVVDRVREVLADVEGRASVEDTARQAEVALEDAQRDLDAAFRTFGGYRDETAARDRLAELQAVRDQAQERVDHLGSHRAVVSINAARDWDRLSLDARRALIRATVERVLVAPGRGADRVTVELFSE